MNDVPPSRLRPLAAVDRRAFEDAVGRSHVLCDPDLTAGHTRDWTGRFTGTTPVVVRPGTTAEVAAVVAHCAGRSIALVAQGGNTGLVGGATPMAGEIVVDLTRLAEVGAVDGAAGLVTAGAGARLATVQATARAAGLTYGIDFAARSTATIGGTVATNAGGTHVVRWGTTRHQLRGIEAVLGDGTVVSHLAGLTKDNTGYDLAGLLCGSEGTLGLVTAVTLALVATPARRAAALVAVPRMVDAVAALARWRAELAELHAAELMAADVLDLVCEHHGLAPPLPGRWAAHLLIEVAGDDPLGALEVAVGADPACVAVAVATDGPNLDRLWRYRDGVAEAINGRGPPQKLDVSIPHQSMAAFLDEVSPRVASVAPASHTWLFGHLGDGNVHVNVTGTVPDPDALDEAVLTLVADHGGAISAEHGIGIAKRAWLHLSRSPAEITAFRAIKSALDPAGILGPGVLLPDP